MINYRFYNNLDIDDSNSSNQPFDKNGDGNKNNSISINKKTFIILFLSIIILSTTFVTSPSILSTIFAYTNNSTFNMHDITETNFFMNKNTDLSKVFSFASSATDQSLNNKLPELENKLKDLQNKVPPQGQQGILRAIDKVQEAECKQNPTDPKCQQPICVPTECPSGQISTCDHPTLECEPGKICNAVCVCPGFPQEELCSGSCVNLLTDKQNCGSCGNLCPGAELCVGGICKSQCEPGTALCPAPGNIEICTDTRTDSQNCGGCGLVDRSHICTGNRTCQNSQCKLQCANGLTDCNGQCIDLNNNNQNCGICGKSCSSNQICENGQCKLQCANGLTDCNGQCIDLNSDERHCNACGNACASNEACENGSCIDICTSVGQAGKTLCPTGNSPPLPTDVCVDLFSDSTNCGSCGNNCNDPTKHPIGSTCTLGLCQCSSDNPFVCDNKCVDINFDANNCGGCGITCPSNQECKDRSCVGCLEGQIQCGVNESCTDPQTDRNNCGGCGITCASDEVCALGTCSKCPSSFPDVCGGDCTNKQNDINNCGTCGHSCAPNETCTNGQCELKCSPGLDRCGEVCSNLQIDDENCGTCGNSCFQGPFTSIEKPSGSTCQSGDCKCAPGDLIQICPPTGEFQCVPPNCHIRPDETGASCIMTCAIPCTNNDNCPAEQPFCTRGFCSTSQD